MEFTIAVGVFRWFRITVSTTIYQYKELTPIPPSLLYYETCEKYTGCDAAFYRNAYLLTCDISYEQIMIWTIQHINIKDYVG
jgi:hypothetical protein